LKNRESNGKKMPDTASRLLSIERVLGVAFFNGDVTTAIERLQRTGGYLVAPVSPSLTKLRYDADYQRALGGADLAIANSGLLVFLWRVISGRKLKRISALSYLKRLLERDGIIESAFWIVSSRRAKTTTIAWLREGWPAAKCDRVYELAPTAGTPEHYELLQQIEVARPENIILGLSGGAQEKIALYLRDYLLYRPKIHCLGAALGFVTGDERAIPDWADRYYLGWLFRIFAQPRLLVPRLWNMFELASMMFKFRSEFPQLRVHWADA
jgi:UDP-N-acetyl-D-mannosaminuronic acid transferase (WecB/TagA/CpsF family)